MVTRAIIGGTVSVLDGGKFANGAMTGAFGYLFNEGQHPDKTAHVMSNPDAFDDGKHSYPNAKGNTECVQFIRDTMQAPPSTTWEEGGKPDANTPRGTVVGTFVDGKFHGHAAVSLSVNKSGMELLDQWNKKPIVSTHTIQYNDKKPFVNNANNYSIVLW
jgi:hypothetical protein